MGDHCDIKYNNKGYFIPWSNSQVHNSPTVIVTFCDNRKLHDRRLEKVSKSNCVTDKTWKHFMTLNKNHILLLNTIDEKPHTYDNGEIMVKHQHCNFSVYRNTMSIASVFRVVDEYFIYDNSKKLMITTTSPSIKEKEK